MDIENINLLHSHFDKQIAEEIQFNFDIKEKIQPRKIFISISTNASIFLSQFCSLSIARINFDKKKQRSLANFYQINQNEFALIFNDEIHDYQDYNFCEYFFNFFDLSQLQQVIVLTSKYQNFYQTDLNSLSVLCTTKQMQMNQIQVVPFLKNHVLIGGLAAHIMIYLEEKNIAGEIYFQVQKEQFPEDQDVLNFQKLEVKFQSFKQPVIQSLGDLYKKFKKNYSQMFL